MSFLVGDRLTTEMRRLASGSGKTKIAIAYWGSDALKRLQINPTREDLSVICCLRGGQSDPEVVKLFGERCVQSDNLHAKVIWTPAEAIVGSANASSNGLPEEEKTAPGLIEAGVHVTEPQVLKEIEVWFDKLFERASTIRPEDLDAAKVARARRIFRIQNKLDLIEMSRVQLKKLRLAIMIWCAETTEEEDRKVEELLPLSYPETLIWWLATPQQAKRYPWGYETLTVKVNPSRTKILGFDGLETFDTPPKKWRKIQASSPLNRVVFANVVEKRDLARRNFTIGPATKNHLKALLSQKNFKLKNDLDSGLHGFVAWEPLDEFLA
jgi:hypothetical protein